VTARQQAATPHLGEHEGLVAVVGG